VLRRIEAKVLKLQTEHGHEGEASTNKVEVYDEMVKDALLDYEVVLLELKLYNSRYELLESSQAYLKRQFDALSLQVTCLRRGESSSF